ncbi:hypothetical protein [Legionella sp. CNM-4043-24]|uniref:hypothetical protein n=1 Tax=Legionella sp. CNM-4043-24 TaxID=3421646 RepID=UPI00403AB6C5
MHPETLKKLCYSLDFFYTQTIHEKTLTETYTGELDVSAAADKRKDCWISERIATVDTPKTLLLTSWYFKSLKDDDREIVVQFFFHLLRAGYSIMISTADGIQAIRGPETLRRQLAEFTSLGATDELQRNDLAIIDAGKLKQIIHIITMQHQGYTHFEGSHILLKDDLTEKDILVLEQNIGSQDTLALNIRSLTAWNVTGSPLLCDRVRSLILENNPAAQKEEDLLLVVQAFKNRESYCFEKVTLTMNGFISLLNSAPGLKKLTMKNCTIQSEPGSESQWNEISTSTLTHLVMEEVSIAEACPLILVHKNPQLEHLHFEGMNDFGYLSFDIPPGYLIHLKELALRDTSMTWEQQKTLILAAPNIEHFYLPSEFSGDTEQRLAREPQEDAARPKKQQRRPVSEPELMPAMLPLPEPDLPVERPGTGLPVRREGKRSVRTEEIAAGQDWTDKTSRRNLISLDLSGCELTEQDLREAFSNPNLAHLELFGCKNLNQALLACHDLYLPALTYCSVDNTDIKAEGLQTLFDICPNLETLSIRNCYPGNNEQDSLSLSGRRGALRNLIASNSRLSDSQLDSILRNEPNLIRLVLDQGDIGLSSTIRYSGVRLTPGQLPCLDYLNLSSLSLETETFNAFWEAAPNLLSLFLIDCAIILPSHLKTNSLMHLDAHASLDAAGVRVLIEACPLLRNMDICSCELENDLLNPDNLERPDLELLVIEESTNLNSAQLNNLLQTGSHSLLSLSTVELNGFNSLDAGGIPWLHRLRELKLVLDESDNKRYVWDLLAKTPNIELLIMNNESDCSFVPDEWLTPGSLSRLQRIDIQYISVIHELLNLVSAAPGLTEIRVDLLQFASSELHFGRGHLRQLRRFSLGRSDINIDQLYNIVENAPCLKAVRLEKCYNLKYEDLERIKREYQNIQWDIVLSARRSLTPLPHTLPQRKHVSRFLPAHTPDLSPDGNFEHNPDTCYKSRELFTIQPGTQPVSPDDYHLYTRRWNEDLQAFTSYQPDEKNLEPVTPQPRSLTDIAQWLTQYDPGHYMGQIELKNLDANTWYQFPALSTTDSMKDFASSIPPELLILRRDTHTGYHFYRLRQAVQEAFMLRFTIQSDLITEPLPADSSELAMIYPLISQLSFASDSRLIQNQAYRLLQPLDDIILISALHNYCTFQVPSDESVLLPAHALFNRMIARRRGACRHRAQLFTALTHGLGFESFYIENDCHAFSIIKKMDGSVSTIPLGGADGSLHIEEINEQAVCDYIVPETELYDISPVPARHSHAPEPSNPYLSWNNRPLREYEAPFLIKELLTRSKSIPVQLIISEDQDSIEALHQSFRPAPNCFFSQQLEDVSLTSSRISGDQYQKVPGPVAALFHEAENNPDSILTWFINWSDAEHKHKGLTTLAAGTRRLQGRDLPDNLHLVLLIDRSTLARMDNEFKCNLPCRSMLPRLQTRIRPVSEKTIDDQDILIVNQMDWKKILLGHFSMEGRRHTFIPGALLTGSSTIHIQNPPMDNRAFRMFLDALENNQGRFHFNGEWHEIPEACRIELHQPLISFPSASRFSIHQHGELILNHSSFPSFFERSRLDENGIHTVPGLLEAHQGQRLHLRVTQQLSSLHYYQLWQEIRRWSIAPILEPTPYVTVPDALTDYLSSTMPLAARSNVRVYVSNDLDYAAWKTGSHETVSISIDTRFESLFIEARCENGDFYGYDTDLLKAIKDGRDLVLKGRFSQTLIQKMQSLFARGPSLQINGEEIPIQGRLTLLSDDESLFTGITYQRLHYDPEESMARLNEVARNSLRACYHELNIQPCFSHFKTCPKNWAAQMPWVRDLKKRLHLAAGIPSKENSPASCTAGIVSGADDLIRKLRHQPFVFLISTSGAGKSHLMKNLPPDIHVYYGLSELKNWLNHKAGAAYLFIDEANISTDDYLILDSLARRERVMWVNGRCYEISSGHRVVFAGNPYAYGGRLQADLFRRFPDYAEFRAQSLQTILEPMLRSFSNPDWAFALIKNSYDHALESGITITPRNAFMICQRVFEMKNALGSRWFSEHVLLQQAILDELKGLRVCTTGIKTIRQFIKEDLLWTSNGKALQQVLQKRIPRLHDKNFHWTDTRIKVALAFLAYLAVQEQRQLVPLDQRQAILGFMLEGRGLGKGLLLRNLLDSLTIRYCEVSLDDPFEARRQLLKAYEAGMLVFIPKFSSDADERLLNDLLSDLDPAKTPGFGVIAVHDGGALSQALSNRFTCLNLKGDSRIEDLQAIVRKRLNPPEELLNRHVQAFVHARDYGRQAGMSPLPRPQSLFEQVRREMEEQSSSADFGLYPGLSHLNLS